MRRILAPVLLAILGGLAGWWVGQWVMPSQPASLSANAPAGATVAKAGAPVPDMQWPRLDGAGQIALKALRGRPVLLNFWASWCGPCIHEMPLLDAYAREQAAHGVQVVGVALDSEADVRAFLERLTVAYPNAVEAPGPDDSSIRLGNWRSVLPYSVLIDAQGRMVAAKSGSFEEAELRSFAQQAAP